MNTTEVTMDRTTATEGPGLDAHTVALEAAAAVIRLSLGVPTPLKSIADQAIRAASSVALNLAEGSGRKGRDRIHHWRIAYASALETSSALVLLKAGNLVHPDDLQNAEALLDRVRAMTWRLMESVS